jgi:hypothetical protein
LLEANSGWQCKRSWGEEEEEGEEEEDVLFFGNLDWHLRVLT